MRTHVPVVSCPQKEGEHMNENEARELIKDLTEDQKIILLGWLTSLQQNLSPVEAVPDLMPSEAK